MKRDILGERFGRLTVLRRHETKRNHVVCACDCGKEWSGYLYSLTTGYTKSCGCFNVECLKTRKYEPRHHDLTGRVFGELTVMQRCGVTSSRGAKWLCRCNCGAQKEIAAHSLILGLTTSCGHVQRERAKQLMTKHGRYKDKDYKHELSLRREAWKRGGKNEIVEPAVVYERDMGLCQLCGLPVGPGELHIDHRIPLVSGGDHSYANCQTTHAGCNYKKGRKQPDDCDHLWKRGGAQWH